MDSKKVTVVAIVLLLVGILAGYLYWGTKTGALEKDLAAARAQAQQATAQVDAMGAKLKSLEAQLKELTDKLAAEKEAREKLQARVSKGKK